LILVMVRAVLEQFLMLVGIIGHFFFGLFFIAITDIVNEKAHFTIIRIGNNCIRKAIFLLFIAEALSVSLPVDSTLARRSGRVLGVVEGLELVRGSINWHSAELIQVVNRHLFIRSLKDLILDQAIFILRRGEGPGLLLISV